ncbi:hypothetical protein BJ322DRAFT_1042473 [Thelephora terrestris]|uniref:BTB domain-containing protein n=1 Tax=Thelephora terrestris TaxID=56493 RepID=A0A9P6HLH4_9AGAM|nr:hypothetical protein BJ322DRAFT_1042473 [Thelephora terrestris]
MNFNEVFNFPDGDVVLRAIYGTGSRDFRVHKSFLSFSSPVLRGILAALPPKAALDSIDVVDVECAPEPLQIILRYIYPALPPPVIDNLSILSEALVLSDKYDIDVARSRLRSSFGGFIRADPLRAYAIACRFGLEDEIKIASSYTRSIHLPDLAELPDEFKLIPATEYHRLILLHSRYHREVDVIASHTPFPRPIFATVLDFFASLRPGKGGGGRMIGMEVAREHFQDSIREGVPLDEESLFRALKAEGISATVSDADIQSYISSILSQADDLNLTV